MKARFQLLFVAVSLVGATVALMNACSGRPAGDYDCGSGADIALRAREGYLGPGSYQISGTVDFPTMLPAGRYVQLTVDRISPDSVSEVTSEPIDLTNNSATYVACNLPNGVYKVQLQADYDGNLSFADAGDFEGFYDGTILTPKQILATAATVTISGGDQSADFGIAP